MIKYKETNLELVTSDNPAANLSKYKVNVVIR